METYKDHYLDVVMNLEGREYLSVQANRRIGAMEKMAPSSTEDKRRFYENERNKILEESSEHPLTETFVLSGFTLDDAFFAEAERLSRLHLDDLNDEGLRVWHWTVAAPIGWINMALAQLEDVPVWNGIAADLSKYISGASDRTLSYIIEKHRLPAGTDRPTWIGKTQDAARFAKIVKMKPSEFNACFCGLKKITPRTFKFAEYAGGNREHELYIILDKYIK
jgi:hypothetical protein